MQYIIIGQDGQDDGAPNRRSEARESHIAYSNIAAKSGEQIFAAAMLDQKANPNGSIMIVDFPTVDDVRKWLDTESYITGDVWKNVQIVPCKIAPAFEHLITKKG